MPNLDFLRATVWEIIKIRVVRNIQDQKENDQLIIARYVSLVIS